MRKHPTDLNARVNRERLAHSDQDVLAESYRIKNRFAHIWQYPSRLRLLSTVDDIVGNLHGKLILDYGCGRGESSMRYLSAGAFVKGIDISPMYIADANRRAAEIGFPAERYQFLAMDAHSLTFPEDTFDLVIGEGILHHLDADIALAEIHRVLKPGGRVVLQEPLADNPLLKLFRFLTPGARTEDERPFSAGDIERLTRRELWRSEAQYCGLIEAPVAMITSLIIPNHPVNKALRAADRVEMWLHKRNILLSWNQYVLLNLVKA